MNKVFSGMMALASLAITMLPACAGSPKSDKAADDTDSIAAVAVEAVESGNPVIEVPTGTPDLSAYAGSLTVIDFNAVWCGPCRQYAPTFHSVAKEMAGKATFLSINVDSCHAIAEKYVGQFIPQTTVITPSGQVFSKSGQLEKETLVAFIDSIASSL
ncbi:MAG: thioredoxin [Pseudoflavonifractor sp.]|nr:thioredoxin [Alloprevotella sp.]MCM1116591.1 thioredoxin [Pseudoflavonifractor sp.]